MKTEERKSLRDYDRHNRDVLRERALSKSGLNRAENINVLTEEGICWLHLPDEPLTLSWYFTCRGQDSFHIYLWIAKDLSWVQAWYWPGMIFGSAAVAWSIYILCQAVAKRCRDEIWTTIASILWLFANLWWMSGELHDYHYPNEASIYNRRATECGYIMMAALIWIGIYYVILKPLDVTSRDTVAMDHYDTKELQHRFPRYFKNWREYENVHILFWVGKDCAWNLGILPMWIAFFVPTFMVALDFSYLSLRSKRMVIDHAHYLAQFLWVFANAVWAFGELVLTPDNDQPVSMFKVTDEALITSRWYSSWVVLASFVPIALLYLEWIPGTCFGVIEDPEAIDKLSSHGDDDKKEIKVKIIDRSGHMEERKRKSSHGVELADSSLAGDIVDGTTSIEKAVRSPMPDNSV